MRLKQFVLESQKWAMNVFPQRFCFVQKKGCKNVSSLMPFCLALVDELRTD